MQQNTEWVGGRFPGPMYLTPEDGEPYRPDVCLWLEVETRTLLGTELLAPNDPDSVIADELERSMSQPLPSAGPPREPSSIRVADPALATLLRERLGGRIDVRVGPVPELDPILADLREHFLEEPGDGKPSYLGPATAPAVSRFFTAAARLYTEEPWTYLDDGELLYLDIPALGIEAACVSIIGAMRESLGAIVFESVAAFRAFIQSRADDTPTLLCPLRSINFEPRAVIPESMHREIEDHGWKVAGARAFPMWSHLDTDLVNRPATDDDYVLAAAIAEGLARFFERHGVSLDEGSFETSAETFTIEDLPGAPVVRIAAPHPEVDWLDPLDDEVDNPYDDEDPEATLEAAMSWVAEFIDAERERGRDAAWLDAAGFVAESLLRFKIVYIDGLPGGWTANLVEDYLLEYFPLKVSADEDLLERTPEVAAAFFAWMQRTERVNTRSGNAIQKRIKTKTRAFLREAHDPDNFGPAKSVFMRMQAAGVDPTNRSEVEGFLKAMNAGISGMQPPLRLVKDDRPRQPTKKAWVWSGEGAPPSPVEPCPCGSGTRYKKCCMPR